MSITALTSADLTRYGVNTFTDYAALVPNLSFNNGGSAQGLLGRTVSIRGIAGPNTTGLYIDDTPVPATIDPRVVDLERIEVLKGPQGTLWGAGSEGGNVRLVTNTPNLSDNSGRYMLKAGGTDHGGQPDFGDEVVANLVMIPDRLAVRLMQFYNADAGFLTRTYPIVPGSATLDASNNNQGQVSTYGFSASALAQLTDRFSATLKLLYQDQRDNGWPAVFETASNYHFTSYTLDRAADVQDRFNDAWYLPALTLRYAGSGFNLTSSTSYFNRTANTVEDGTEGTQQAFVACCNFVTTEPFPWATKITDDIFTEEDRLAFDQIFHVSGVLGYFYSDEQSLGVWEPEYAQGIVAAGVWPTDLIYFGGGPPSSTEENAVYGELYLHLPLALTATVGARKYWINQSLHGYETGLFQGGTDQFGAIVKSTGVVPKYSLSDQLTPNTMAYATVSKGFRPGGGGSPLPAVCNPELANLGLTPESPEQYKPDSVWNYEVGAKTALLDRRLMITGALFQMNWTGIQTQVFLPICAFGFTTNAGAARSRGAELEINARPLNDLLVRAAVGYDNAVITDAGASQLVAGSRINGIPLWTASAGGEYDFALGPTLTGFGIIDYSYTGNSPSLNNSTGQPLIRPSYGIGNASAGVRWKDTSLSLYVSNFTNSHANLGDLTAISFTRQVPNAQGEPTNDLRVVVPLPLTIGLQWSQSF